MIANTPKEPSDVETPSGIRRVATIDATGLALELGLRVAGLPVPNTAMVGAVAKATGLASWEAVEKAIRDTLSGKGAEVNVEAANEGYDKVRILDR